MRGGHGERVVLRVTLELPKMRDTSDNKQRKPQHQLDVGASPHERNIFLHALSHDSCIPLPAIVAFNGLFRLILAFTVDFTCKEV